MKTKYITSLACLLSLLSFYYLALPYIPSHLHKIPILHSRILQSSGDTSLLPFEFTISNQFEIYCLINTTDPSPYVIMVIKYNQPNQYFSIGFGTRMKNADMWVFEIVNNAVTANDYYGLGDSYPPTDTSRGGRNDLVVLGYEIGSTYSLIKIKRLLDTKDPNDAVINPGTTDVIWAGGPSPTLSYHKSNYGYLQLNLEKAADLSGFSSAGIVSLDSTITAEGASGDDSVTGTVKVHTIISLIAWGLLADVGIILVRLLKGRNLTIRNISISSQTIHGLFMLAVIIMSIVVTATVIEEADYPMEGPPRQRFHYIAGLIMLGLMGVMVFSGVWSYLHLKYYKNARSRKIKINKWVHIVLGVALYLMAKANFITGALLYDNTALKIVIWVYLGALLLIHIVVQSVVTFSFKQINKLPTPAKRPLRYLMNTQLLEAINRGDSKEKLLKDYAGVLWMILDNSVYDLTKFVHPGGKAVLKACVGREVGRYYYGNYALEGSKVKAHKHSAMASSLLKKFYLGEITEYESVLVLNKSINETISNQKNIWAIVGVKPITETTAQICFRNSNQIHIKNFGASLSSLGRHFRISQDKNHSQARLYTTALSLNAANVALRQNILEYFYRIMAITDLSTGRLSSINFHFDRAYLEPQDHLPLYIKKYPISKTGLSNVLHNIEIHKTKNSFRIIGPLGRGLELTNTSTGSHCIICAGTGLLPFVDFLYLFLWKTIYDLIKNKAGRDKAEEINILKMPFDNYFNNMKITFVGAFPGKEDILGLDIIVKLAEISSKYGTDNFVAMMRGYEDGFVKGIQGRFTKEFLNAEVGLNHERYYVCGPPQMNTNIPRDLEASGVDRNKIFLV